MTVTFPSGHICIIDDQDAKLFEKHKWHLVNGYAQTEVGSRRNGTRKTLRLHRLIMNAGSGQMIDHKNRNPLDNRRSNLRFCDKSTNGMNRPAQSNNTSGFKGVSFHKPRGRWRAYITVMKKTRHLGLFDTADDAHKAYIKAAEQLHKEFICV